MHKQWWYSSCGRIELMIDNEIIEDVAQSGANDDAVDYWLSETSASLIQREILELVLDEYGIFEDIKQETDETLQSYLLWIACHDLAEEQE